VDRAVEFLPVVPVVIKHGKKRTTGRDAMGIAKPQKFAVGSGNSSIFGLPV